MIRMQKKRAILRKTKSKSISEIKTFSLITVLKNSTRFVLLYKKVFISWCLANFIFLYLFRWIPNGWTNSLSILWLVAYYVFWCVFIRYVPQHQPYFSLIRIFNGLIPTSKIMFINISIYVLLAITPYIPFFMGFRDKYLEFFESYMAIMQSNNSLLSSVLVYVFMILISPYTIIRPYIAFIGAIIGRNRSIMDAYKRTWGNYVNFVIFAVFMSGFIMLSYGIDDAFKINSKIILMSILPIYFNIVMINVYKIFYKYRAKTKQ